MTVSLDSGQTLALRVDGKALAESAHRAMTCNTCHSDKGAYPHAPVELTSRLAYRARAVQLCSRCHATVAGAYAASAHADSLLSGKSEGATCYDCHSENGSAHSVRSVAGPQALVLPRTVLDTCGRCHPDELDSYLETSHAKVVRFGNPMGAATCVTCHDSHEVKRVEDPEAGLTRDKLVAVCATCHSGANDNFAAGWVGHRGASLTRFPAVYFTERFFVFLTAVVVGLGIVHVELDFYRWLAERSRNGKGRR
ncbi:MAG: cytochrome c3 family protein [Chloroflexota bacterium]|nr:cytochrome c3 family protein [Chloroflexota bacterium]